MGKPAESRSLLAHLLNISYPYDYTSPKFALIGEGVEELTEQFDPDDEDIQYIHEITKTKNVKGYTVGFDLEMKYIKDSEIQKYANRLVRKPPIGSNTVGDYIRFNKDEIMYGTNNKFIGVRRRATVYPESVGGGAEDSLSSSLHVSGNTDPEVGYVTVTNGSFDWTSAPTEVPIITSPAQDAVVSGATVTITGTGLPGATITVYYGIDKSLEPVTADASGNWSTTISVSELGNLAKIAATQSVNGVGSVTSEVVGFTAISSVEAPVITVPVNGATDVSLTPTISGTGVAGATLKVKSGNDEILSTTVSSSGQWTATVSSEDALTVNTEYTITATQTLGNVTSSASTAVSFTTVSQ